MNTLIDIGSNSIKIGDANTYKLAKKITLKNDIIKFGYIDKKNVNEVLKLIKDDIKSSKNINISTSIDIENNTKNLIKSMYPNKNITFNNSIILISNSIGNHNCIIIDIGHTITKIVPFYEGYYMEEFIKYSNLCGKSMIRNNKEKKKAYKTRILNTIDNSNFIEKVKVCIRTLPMDIRKQLSQNIYLIGGISNEKYVKRMIIKRLKNNDYNVKDNNKYCILDEKIDN